LLIVKRLIKQRVTPNNICGTDGSKNKNEITPVCIVDILTQIEELKDYNVAIKKDDGRLLLAVGDSVYDISEKREKRYPRRKLTKLET